MKYELRWKGYCVHSIIISLLKNGTWCEICQRISSCVKDSETVWTVNTADPVTHFWTGWLTKTSKVPAWKKLIFASFFSVSLIFFPGKNRESIHLSQVSQVSIWIALCIATWQWYSLNGVIVCYYNSLLLQIHCNYQNLILN